MSGPPYAAAEARQAAARLGLAALLALGGPLRAADLVPPPDGPGAVGSSSAGLTDQEGEWARTAWAYFDAPAVPVPPAADGSQPPPAPAFLAPLRNDAPFATAWSIGDQVAALVLARRLGIIDTREFDRRFSRLVDFLSWMPLVDGMPNRFYQPATGEALGGDLQPGLAGWSAVDTGRLLLWLRLAAEAHPEFAPFIRAGLSRLSVCDVLAEGRLQLARLGPQGLELSPESGRGYDAYAAQGFRAWGMDLPLAAAGPGPFEIEIEGVRFPLFEDVGNQPAVLTTAPAYLGLELGFETIGGTPDEVAGGRTARDLMEVVHDVQEARWEETGVFTARADYGRSSDPYEIQSTILDDGFPWSVADAAGLVRPDRGLIATRAVFALDAFFDSDYAEALRPLVRELRDPSQGWFEGRSETTGAWETTRTSVTNAFVLEVMAHHRLGTLFADSARPDSLSPVAAGPDGACRLPLAAGP